MDLKDLRNKRGKLIADARAILDKADTDKRAITDEEDAQYKRCIEEVKRIDRTIEAEEATRALERSAAEATAQAERQRNGGGVPGDPMAELRAAAWTRYLRGGPGILNADEHRALSAGTDTQGGFLYAPEQFVASILKAVDDLVFIRGLATKFSVPTADSLGVPTLDTDPADANWTVELATGSEDSSMAFGKRSLTPHPMAKRIKVSNTLIRKVPNVDALVIARLAYKFGITHEKAFLSGSGAGQPLGVFTASDDGITTSRDYSTGNTATEMRFDGLIGAKYTLKGAYWPKAQWIFHRDGLAQIAKLKDGDGNYIWRQSVREGEPDTLLGRPINMSEYSPNTFTASQYVGIFGDFSNYWIADATNMQLQRLAELYAETNQVGIIGRQESDGMPVLSEAFVRVKLAAS